MLKRLSFEFKLYAVLWTLFIAGNGFTIWSAMKRSAMDTVSIVLISAAFLLLLLGTILVFTSKKVGQTDCDKCIYQPNCDITGDLVKSCKAYYER